MPIRPLSKGSITLLAALFLVSCNGVVNNSPAVPASGAAPTVIAVAVQVNGVAPDRKQEVQFSEAMDPTTINAKTFTVTDSSGSTVGGVVGYDSAYEIANFLPDPPLQINATYNATMGTGVASMGGAHLAAPYSYTFTTRSYSDTSPISINSVVPAANATCVSTTMPIIITFDEAPDASTVNSTNIVVTGPGGAVIPVTMSINVTTTQVVLTPNSALPSGTISVTVQNVGDLANVKMLTPYTWSFSTACSSGGGSGVQIVALCPLIGGFSVLAGTTVTNTGSTTVSGDVGVSPGTAVTGFPPGLASGAIHSADGAAGQAETALTAGYIDAAGRPGGTSVSGDLVGRTLTAGVYTSTSSLAVSGDVTLDAQGNPDAVFIFQIGSTLTTGSGSHVILANGAKVCNVFWQVGSSATLGTNSQFKGNILALTSITITTGVNLEGRALARNGAVTLDSDVITGCTCP